jgi:hypothetical protein
MGYPRHDKKTKRTVLDAVASGVSVPEAAAQYKLAKGTVYTWLRKRRRSYAPKVVQATTLESSLATTAPKSLSHSALLARNAQNERTIIRLTNRLAEAGLI